MFQKIYQIVVMSLYIGSYFLIRYWWISLPLYAGLLYWEFCSITKLNKILDRVKSPLYIWILQVMLPVLPFILYPVMPGEDHNSGFHWHTEKCIFSLVFTMLLLIDLPIIFALRLRVLYRYVKPE